MTRKPLSPEATEALHEAMRKACERMERRKAEEEAERLAEENGRVADALGANL